MFIVFYEAITLKFEIKFNFYENLGNVFEDVFLIDKLSNLLIVFSKSKNLGVDISYGVSKGATKLRVISQDK